MPSPSPQQPGDIRFRRHLDETLQQPHVAAGFTLRNFTADDAPALHDLFTVAFDDTAPFDVWWPKLSGDSEFDPALCFLVHDAQGRLAAAAQCWTSAYVKDLAVAPFARRNGLAEALMWHVFATFKARGADHVDLKTNLVVNADAARLYRRIGMVEVNWEG